MGVDIELYVEVLTENGWEFYKEADINRNYALFAKLADVRNPGGIKPIAFPRGLPYTASPKVKKAFTGTEYDPCESYAISHIDSREIVELFDWVGQSYSFDLEDDIELAIMGIDLEGQSFSGFFRFKEDYPEWIEDIRFVFGFNC